MSKRLDDIDGYAGLYAEVVTTDCYRLKSLTWQPDTVLDLGANCGVFARYARALFPSAYIVSVEPNPENQRDYLANTRDTNTLLIRGAIGGEEIWHHLGAPNGAHECYTSAGLGYPREELSTQEVAGDPADRSLRGFQRYWGPTFRLEWLIDTYCKPGEQTVLKIDIEGGENAIWEDPGSIQAMQRMDYIAMELHWYALHGGLLEEVRRKTLAALATLAETHTCELDNTAFFATKR